MLVTLGYLVAGRSLELKYSRRRHSAGGDDGAGRCRDSRADNVGRRIAGG